MQYSSSWISSPLRRIDCWYFDGRARLGLATQVVGNHEGSVVDPVPAPPPSPPASSSYIAVVPSSINIRPISKWVECGGVHTMTPVHAFGPTSGLLSSRSDKRRVGMPRGEGVERFRGLDSNSISGA